MHLLRRDRPLRKRIPQLFLLLRVHHTMIRPQRRITILLAGLSLISTCFQDLLRRTDMHIVPFPEAQKDADIDTHGAEELDNGSGGIKVVRGQVLLEDVDNLEDGEDKVDEEEEEASHG